MEKPKSLAKTARAVRLRKIEDTANQTLLASMDKPKSLTKNSTSYASAKDRRCGKSKLC